MSVTRIDYCHLLLSSQMNYTMTNFADHGGGFSHDSVNRLMRCFTAMSSNLWVLKNASAERPGSKETTLPAPCCCGLR